MVYRSALLFLLLAAPLTLTSCALGLDRDAAASRAKKQMIGMPKEEVLACMGPPRKKATEGKTDVWSYLSTDGESRYNGSKIKFTSYESTSGARNKRYCIVNVVLREGRVHRVYYLGPSATNFFNEYDQCGYAVKGCIE